MTIQEFENQDDWTCPYCHQITGRFYKKIHYRCLPEDKKRELEREEESKFETCPTCNKPVDPYYKNFHICEANSINTKPNTIGQKQNQKQEVPTHEYGYSRNRWNRFRRRRKSILHGSGLGEFLRHKAVLEGEWWILYIDGVRIGPVEKATKEELTSWDPTTDNNEGEKQQ